MELTKIWFDGTAPVNAKKASTTIGSGDNGVVTITADNYGADGNDLTIQAVQGVGNNIAMSAVLSGNNIILTLGTDGTGVLDATKNTAILVATAIASLNGVTATKSGTGVTAISAIVAKKNLAGGQDATECPVSDVFLNDGTYYYTNPLPVGKRDSAGWKRFQLADF